MAPRVGIYVGRELGAYGYDEKPWFLPHERLEAFLAELRQRGLDRAAALLEAPPASDADLLRFHTPAHLERVRRLCDRNEGALDHGPTLARQAVEAAAPRVVGAVVDASRRLLAGELRRAFVPIAGFHHAHAEEARSYCLYNDCAVALSFLVQQGIEGPIAYVDIDAHHGDGVYAGPLGPVRRRPAPGARRRRLRQEQPRGGVVRRRRVAARQLMTGTLTGRPAPPIAT
ncbi:hypothetical protein WMF30_20865 [Sorangium sp. So ce134]